MFSIIKRNVLPILLVVLLFTSKMASAQPEASTDQQELERIKAVIDRGLNYLAQQQLPDGSWNCGLGSNSGVNALVLLAFLGRGHHPERSAYRQLLRRGRDFLLRQQQTSGQFVSPNPSHGPMYEHALATLALTEYYGMTEQAGLDTVLQRAIDLMVAAQSPEGGWRYLPEPKNADLSVTVMQIVALRAAQNAGLAVPQETLTRALGYVKSCAHRQQGGFGYQPGHSPGPGRTAAGILSLQLAGEPTTPEVQLGLQYLNDQPIQWNGPYFYYFHYYAIQAQYQAGGSTWHQWHPQVRSMFLNHQLPDGSWPVPPQGNEQSVAGPERIYSTAVACLILEIYLHYLPAYQR